MRFGLVGQSTGWLADYLIDWLDCWSVGGAGWLIGLGWLAWLVASVKYKVGWLLCLIS